MQRTTMIGLGAVVLVPVLALAYFVGLPAGPRAVAPGAGPAPASAPAAVVQAAPAVAARPGASGAPATAVQPGASPAPAAALQPAPPATARPEPSAAPPVAARSGASPAAAVPAAPPATAQPPASAATAQAPSFDVVRVGAGGSAVIAGRAAPGAEVVLLLDGGREIGRTRADRRGEWVILPAPIAPGAWELSLRARLGEVETAAADSVVVMVPEPAPPAAPATAAGAFAVLLPPSAPPRLLQAPASEPAAAPGLAIGAVEHGAGTAMRVTGTAPPGAAVQLHLDGQRLGETMADAEGRWQVAAPAGASEGTLRVDRIGADGRVAARAEAPFAAAAAPPPGRRVVVERGANLWRIARMNYGQGPRYTVIYEANRGQIRDPGRIYPGQVLAVPDGQATPASSRESR